MIVKQGMQNAAYNMQYQRELLSRLENVITELNELSLELVLDDRQTIEIEASIKRLDKLYYAQHSFVGNIEKEVIRQSKNH